MLNKQKLDILIESEIGQSELTYQQRDWLRRRVDGTWEYVNGVVNVKGDVNLLPCGLTTIPLQFGIVSEYFACRNNKLTSLKGCPSEVGGNFLCNNNQLTSLQYMPTKIGGKIHCNNNAFILNDKLFQDLARIDNEMEIDDFNQLILELKKQIPIQFGITDETVIENIWQSYMHILESE